MPRTYRHISKYKEEIKELREKGLSQREIGEALGFQKDQIKKYLKREREKQQKLEVGIVTKAKGRPPKDYAVGETDKVSELKYILARKETKIKQLEMENELMRDFLSHTGRK